MANVPWLKWKFVLGALEIGRFKEKSFKIICIPCLRSANLMKTAKKREEKSMWMEHFGRFFQVKKVWSNTFLLSIKGESMLYLMVVKSLILRKTRQFKSQESNTQNTRDSVESCKLMDHRNSTLLQDLKHTMKWTLIVFLNIFVNS